MKGESTTLISLMCLTSICSGKERRRVANKAFPTAGSVTSKWLDQKKQKREKKKSMPSQAVFFQFPAAKVRLIVQAQASFKILTLLPPSHASQESRQRREAFARSSFQQSQDWCCRPSKRWQVHLLQCLDKLFCGCRELPFLYYWWVSNVE